MNRIECPTCGHRLKYGDEHVGKKAKCQKCAHCFRLPSSATAGVAEESLEPDETDEAPAMELRPTLYVVGALIALLVVGAVVVDRFSDEQERRAFLPLIFGMTLRGLVGALIGAVTLRAAAKWAASIDFPYGAAYLTVLLAYLITMAIAVPTGLLISSEVSRRAGELATRYLFVPVQIPILIVLISTRHRVSLIQGAKIVGVLLLVALAIGALLAGFTGLMFWVMSR